jgi:RNA polymerase sigma-70 factor, ECF subfamily
LSGLKRLASKRCVDVRGAKPPDHCQSRARPKKRRSQRAWIYSGPVRGEPASADGQGCLDLWKWANFSTAELNKLWNSEELRRLTVMTVRSHRGSIATLRAEPSATLGELRRRLNVGRRDSTSKSVTPLRLHVFESPVVSTHVLARESAPSTLTPMRAGDADNLVERAKHGDRAAFRELFRRHRSDVARLAYRMIGQSADLEDIIQEVFLQVHRSLGEFRGQSKFSTWLHRVTVNVVLMSRRAAKSRPVFAAEITDAEVDAGPLPDEDAIRRIRVAAFRRVLDKLPEKKRTVFVLHEIEGVSPVEIAQIVDAPVLTVRTRLFYARREICELMREEPSLQHLADDVVAPKPETEQA